MIGSPLKASSGLWAVGGPYVCGIALILTTGYGLLTGWLVETTLATVAARAVLVWIAAMWALSYATEPDERTFVCIAGAIVTGAMVASASFLGIVPTVAVAMLFGFLAIGDL